MSRKQANQLSINRRRDYVNSIRRTRDNIRLEEDDHSRHVVNQNNYYELPNNDILDHPNPDNPFYDVNQDTGEADREISPSIGENNIINESENTENVEENNSIQDGEDVEESEDQNLMDVNNNDNEHFEHSRLEGHVDDTVDSDEENTEDFYDQPLYRDAPICIKESMLLILTLFLSHNMTKTLLSDLLIVINLHGIRDEAYHHSLYKFEKFFSFLENNSAVYKKHFYCSSCLKTFDSITIICDACEGKIEYFIEIPFLQQLEELYKRRNFYQLLQHRFQRNTEANTINDIYDGIIYKRMVANGFLSDKNMNNISLMWYTDGVPVFKSSGISMWPIYLSINELPFKERMKRSNTLLAGLWFGHQKPDANTFLQKLKPEFDKLFNGVNFTLFNGQIKHVQGTLLYGTCDLPAKEQFLNLKQFNGFHGCPSCLCEGQSEVLESGGTTHVYPYLNNLQSRTSENTRRYATIALGANGPVMGVRGPTVLQNLMPDFIAGTAIDRMHAIDGGVVKRLLSLWFDSPYRSCRFSLINVIGAVNERLINIKPPKFIHRMPRSVGDLANWKSSELKAWLFHYSVPVLYGIMQYEYFNHFLLLVNGIILLNSDSITELMISTASNYLNKFVREFETLYHIKFCTINIHQILHLPQCVKNLGPLWAYTCYYYEDLNGQFLNSIHGTWHIDSQIATVHTQTLRMQRYLDELAEGIIKIFCCGQRYQVKINEKLFDGVYSVGTYKPFIVFQIEIFQLVQNIVENHSICRIYYRLLKHGKLYVSKRYPQILQTNSSYVIYQDDARFNHFGMIDSFIKISRNCDCQRNKCTCNGSHYAIIQKLNIFGGFRVIGDNNVNTLLPNLYRCLATNEYILVPIECLLSIVVYMDIENSYYVSIPVNDKEVE